MITQGWERLKYFSKNENWGDWTRINPKLLIELDSLREYAKVPMFISCGTQGFHAQDSEHFKGNAVDVVLTNAKIDLLDFYFFAERFDFSGIGIYPHWSYLGTNYGGLHLDVGDRRGRWCCSLDQQGKQKYVAINKSNLKLLGLT